MIIEASEGKNCLDDAMQLLYDRTWKVNIGYSKETYQMVLETTAGISFADYFSEVIDGRGKMEVWLTDALDKLGLSVEKQVDEAGLVKFSVVKLLEPTNLQKRFFGFWSQSH
jgi:predicted metalloprotease with PDZ domain